MDREGGAVWLPRSLVRGRSVERRRRLAGPCQHLVLTGVGQHDVAAAGLRAAEGADVVHRDQVVISPRPPRRTMESRMATRRARA
jgi:hypothetical protein